MASYCSVTIIGNVGKDPVQRFMPNGDAVVNFSVATTETWKDKNGEKQEKTQWHYITAYRKLAEIVGKYVKSGSSVYINGKIEYNKYTDKEGIEKVSTNIVANELLMLSGKSDKNTSSELNPQKNTNNEKQLEDDFEDDIPF